MRRNHARALPRWLLCATLVVIEQCVAPVDTDASAEAAATDTPSDHPTDTAALDAGVCRTSTDCPIGYACAFTVGCGVEGRCALLDVPCDAIDIQMEYCTCEGTTLVGRPGDCPGSRVPWAHAGPCVDAANDAGD